MHKDNPMPLLLIEDDVAECIKFKDCSNRRADIAFVGMTGSSDEGLKYLQTRLPEGIILDLQLTKGKGSGLQFLTLLKETELAFRPIIVVTTTNQSTLVYRHIERMGVDWVFCKEQNGYSADLVIETLLDLRKSLHSVQRDGTPSELLTLESPEERRQNIIRRIEIELDLVGINARYKGRDYLHEAILILIISDKETTGSAIDQVAAKYKTAYSVVTRVMQTAINKAWDNANIEDLVIHYTARVSIKTGVPSPPDFIHYYANKIRKTM